MGRARKIVLKTRTFEKHGDGTLFFQEMLGRYEIGERVSNEDAEDLEALLERHDDRDGKVGSGINGFEVNLPPDEKGHQFSERCFWIIRVDGSKIDFSYPHCLKRKPYD
jgi:hypothetical protein